MPGGLGARGSLHIFFEGGDVRSRTECASSRHGDALRALTPVRRPSASPLRHVIAVALLAVHACASLARRDPSADTVAGEWVDVNKSTAVDTMVWVLAPDGDDELLHIAVDNSTTHSARRHFGRWSLGRSPSGERRAALCFVRRPGRDAASCVDFTLDTIRTFARPVRRLLLRGYVGEHHTGDRELRERLPRASVESPSGTRLAHDETSPGGANAGGFQARAVQPERPSVATHAGTVAPGYAELETGFERDRDDDGTSARTVPSVLKVGLSRRTQLSVQLPATSSTGVASGIGDAAIGMKWRFTEDDPRLQDLALLPQIKLPTGGPRGSGTTDVSLLLINSRTFGPVSVDLNVGVTRRSGDGSRAPRTASMWAVAMGLPLHDRLGWALETFGYPGTGGDAGGPPTVSLLTGPTLVLVPELELDVGMIVPLLGAPPRGLYAGFVSNLGRLRSPR